MGVRCLTLKKQGGNSKIKCMKFGVPSGIPLYCQQCNKDVETLIQNGEVIYPTRPDLADHVFLQCPKCGNYVGADNFRPNNTIMKWKKRHAKKTIPTAEMRLYRRRIHDQIDIVWQSNLMKRGEIYKRLSKATGINYHNGSLCDGEVARKAYREALKIRREAEVIAGRRLGHSSRRV